MLAPLTLLLCFVTLIDAFSPAPFHLSPWKQDLRDLKSLTKRDLRVLNGGDADEGEYPFFGAVCSTSFFGEVANSQFCGSSLINEWFVLTAAHCLEDGETGIRVFFNTTDLGVDESTVQPEDYVNVEWYTVHESYFSGGGLAWDIAVMKLERPIHHIEPVQLVSNQSMPPKDTRIEIIGFGAVDFAPFVYPTILQEGHMYLKSEEECQDKVGDDFTDGYKGFLEPPVPVCLLNLEDEIISEPGDSGGPAFFYEGDSVVQLGLVSFGSITPDSEDFYSSVLAFSDWIVDRSNIDHQNRPTPFWPSSSLILEYTRHGAKGNKVVTIFSDNGLYREKKKGHDLVKFRVNNGQVAGGWMEKRGEIKRCTTFENPEKTRLWDISTFHYVETRWATPSHPLEVWLSPNSQATIWWDPELQTVHSLMDGRPMNGDGYWGIVTRLEAADNRSVNFDLPDC